MMKKIMMLFRTGTRLALLIFIGLFITMGLVMAFFKPIYEVTLNGEIIGKVKGKYCVSSTNVEYNQILHL